jgi:hypothetical protein
MEYDGGHSPAEVSNGTHHRTTQKLRKETTPNRNRFHLDHTALIYYPTTFAIS